MLEQIAKERVLLRHIREKCNNGSQPGVSIVIPTIKPKYMNNIFMNYMRLKYPCIELIIVLNNNQLNIDAYKLKSIGLKDIQIFQLDESCTLGECMNFGIEQSKYNYITKMDDDDYYGANYLTDLMNVFKYTNADITGKTSSFVYFESNNTLYIRDDVHQYRYINILLGSTILAKKEVFEKVKFRTINRTEDVYFLEDSSASGFKIYAADKFNYVCMRHKNLQEHTWKKDPKELMRICKKLLVTKNFVPFITL